MRKQMLFLAALLFISLGAIAQKKSKASSGKQFQVYAVEPQATRLRAMASARINAKNFFMVILLILMCRVPRPNCINRRIILPDFVFCKSNRQKIHFIFCSFFTQRIFSCVFFHFLRNNPHVYAQYAQRHSHFYHCKSQRFWRASCRNCIKKTFTLQNKPFCRVNILHIVVSGHLLRFSASHSSSYIRSVEGTLSRSRTE